MSVSKYCIECEKEWHRLFVRCPDCGVLLWYLWEGVVKDYVVNESEKSETSSNDAIVFQNKERK